MSRSSTSTPPPSYFPPHNVTPSMRHGSAPTMSAAMYNQRPHHHTSKRRSKNLPSSPSGISTSSARKVATQILGFSYEDIPSLKSKQARGITVVSPIPHAESSASLAMSTTSDDCFNSSCAEASLPLTTEDSFRDQHDELMDRSTSTPAMSTTGSSSTTPLATPSSSRAPSLIQHESGFADLVFRHFNLDFAGVGPSSGATPVPISSVAAPARASWVPNFGKMAKAVVHTGMSMSMSFGEKRAKKDVTLQQPRQSDSERELCKDLPLPAQGLQQVADREPTIKKGEWLAADQKRILECARLCSQWPQSGYNLAKFGPNGAKHGYQPQTYSNSEHIANLMFRQAELERAMYTSSATFYTCHSAHPAPSEADTEPSVESFDSSHSLNTASKLHFPPDSPAQTAAELEAAMASPLLSLSQSSFDHGSQESLSPCDSPTSMKHTRSLTELDVLASSMVLSKFDCGMDFESNDGHQECDVADNQAVSDTLSCGAKRPFTRRGAEEDKRRRVDEAMVVEEAVDTGVIVPNNTQCLPSSFPGSASNLSQGQLGSPAVFGHVVKTSDTHPIIISPFFPAELLPVLSAHLVPPQCSGAFSTQSPMTSAIDVPSLLLSFIPPAPNPELAPSSMQSVFRQQQIAQQSSHVQNLGNLLLSSCPGKRLRMGGPVKGRGPVCRDLCTDLRRIKSEGVGCLICCLDDAELELLGVPWETYREVSESIGLDVLRLPMPDGLTPVSLSLFDAHINVITSNYSLHGINVLVHCRGGVGRAGLTACAWAVKMGFVPPHPSLAIVEQAAIRQGSEFSPEREHQIVMSIVERVIAMIRSRRGLKAIESFEQVQFLARYVEWLRSGDRAI